MRLSAFSVQGLKLPVYAAFDAVGGVAIEVPSFETSMLYLCVLILQYRERARGATEETNSENSPSEREGESACASERQGESARAIVTWGDLMAIDVDLSKS